MVQKSVGSCLLCVPLRLGVSIIAMGHFVYAFVCIGALCTGDLRLQSGGYNPQVARLQAMVGSAGLLFGFLGLLGVNDGKLAWLRAFNTFQSVKLAVLGFVFVCDLASLAGCEGHLSAGGRAQIALDAISSEGLCPVTRLCYIVGFVLDFGANCYFVWVARDFCAKQELCPADIILFPGNDRDSHTQVTFLNTTVGEPACFLGPPLARPQEVFGHGYGALRAGA
mmetsp:Transcript_120650/g.257700  ORF Transcript_120650/g.257700 Transcript_120650/m.257700 type:complete len:224 (+) Transcript_120650:139-810(+)